MLRSELREMQSETFACFVSGKKSDKFHLNKELNGSGEKKAYHFMLEKKQTGRQKQICTVRIQIKINGKDWLKFELKISAKISKK